MKNNVIKDVAALIFDCIKETAIFLFGALVFIAWLYVFFVLPITLINEHLFDINDLSPIIAGLVCVLYFFWLMIVFRLLGVWGNRGQIPKFNFTFQKTFPIIPFKK